MRRERYCAAPLDAESARLQLACSQCHQPALGQRVGQTQRIVVYQRLLEVKFEKARLVLNGGLAV